jgi:hypothetical protein
LLIAREHAKELEKKLEASEKARSDAEAKSASAEDLQSWLDAAELALSDKNEEIFQREANIIGRLDKQSNRFSSTVVLSLLHIFCLRRLHVCIDFFFLFFSRAYWRNIYQEPRRRRWSPGLPLAAATTSLATQYSPPRLWISLDACSLYK